MKGLIELLNFLIKLLIGYGSDDGASTHLVLFVAYYNFLRPHPYNYWRPLNTTPELDKAENMPAKWITMIQMSQQIILSKQSP